MKNLPDIWKVPRKKCSKSDISLNGEGGTRPSGDDYNNTYSPVTPSSYDTNQFALSLHLLTNEIPLDFAEPRINKRVKNVLDWCLRMGINKPAFRISKTALSTTFGHQTNHTSLVLRTVLLTKMRGHVKSKQKSTEWKISTGGFMKLWNKFYGEEFDIESIEENEIRAWEKIVKAHKIGPFSYTEPTAGGRRYHELQQMPKKYKAHFYGGFYDYDLSTANVTLISQQAKMINEELDTPRLDKYIKNKSAIRDAIGTQFGLSKKEIKEVMQAVFSLAYFDDNDHCGVYRKLGKEKLVEFVNHPFLQELRAEITECWRVLLPNNAWADGVLRFKAYEKIEREVLDAIEIDLRGHHYLLQHDGFLLMETTPLDISRVMGNLKERLGYDIIIDEDLL